jgi:hypothetical protein
VDGATRGSDEDPQWFCIAVSEDFVVEFLRLLLIPRSITNSAMAGQWQSIPASRALETQFCKVGIQWVQSRESLSFPESTWRSMDITWTSNGLIAEIL